MGEEKSNSVSNDRALLNAINRGNRKEEVIKLLSLGANPNAKDIFGETALTKAILMRSGEMVAALLQKGADVNLPNISNSEVLSTPLIIASGLGRGETSTEIIRMLLKRGASSTINTQNGKGRTALAIATLNCSDGIAKILLENGADPNLPDGNGITPLLFAASEGERCTSTLEMLLQKGVDVNHQNREGVTALMVAASKGAKNNVRALLRANAEPNLQDMKGETALIKAIKYIRSVQVFRAQNIDRDRLMDHDMLHGRGRDPDLETKQMIMLLLNAGADPNIEDNSGYTPLNLSIYGGVDLALIHVLLQKGADPNHTISSNGITPLMLAAHKGLNGIVKLLLRKGVDPNQKDILGNVALIYASEKGHSEVIMTLLRAGADLTISNKKGQSFLTYISRFPEAQAFREAYLAESRGELLRNPKILSPDIVGEITKFLFKGKKSKGKKSKKSKRKSVKKTKKSIRRVYK